MLEKIGGLHFIDFDRMRDDAVIVDAGACEGKYIEILAERIPGCRIIAIECDKDHIETLKEKNFSGVVICKKALVGYNSKGKMVYYKYIGLPHSGSVGYEKTYIKKYGRKYKGIETYLVDTLDINDIFSEFDIDRIDYLKMNIEGAERDVLSAMTKETALKIDQISVSIHTKIKDDLAVSVLNATAEVDIIGRMRELGFKSEKVDRRLMYGVRED